jgi:dipeptidyl-peptidase III
VANQTLSIKADGGEKIMPDISHQACRKLAAISEEATNLLEKAIAPMLSLSPAVLGYPGDNAQANYYLGPNNIARNKIALVGKVLEAHSIEPENTRIAKSQDSDKSILEVTIASPTGGIIEECSCFADHGTVIRLVGGDHSREMSKISDG